MSKQALVSSLFGLVFLVIAIIEYVRDSSGIGLVFLVFAGVFVALQFRGRHSER
jgi:uncharacterized membrane protein